MAQGRDRGTRSDDPGGYPGAPSWQTGTPGVNTGEGFFDDSGNWVYSKGFGGGGNLGNGGGGGGGFFNWLKKLSPFGGNNNNQQDQGYQMLGLNDVQNMIKPQMQLDTGSDYFSRLFNQNKMRPQQPFQWGGFNG